MPLDPKKTKNGVDLNQVDVSKLALVDKEGLIDDLKTRLSAEIKKAVRDAVDDAKDVIYDTVAEGVSDNIPSQPQQPQQKPASPPPSSSGGTTQTPVTPPDVGGGSVGSGGSTPPQPPRQPRQPRPPSGPRPPGPPTSDPQKDFEDLLKVQRSTEQMIDKLTASQKKKNTAKRKEDLKGNVYSDKGKGLAESVDEMADEYTTYSKKELEQAKRKLSDIQESIRFNTVGQEQKVLTDSTKKLAKALELESKQRGTMLGKMSNFMQEENINAVSIITAMTTNSPIVGLMSRYMMNVIKEHKDKAQKEKADKIKVGDIKQVLPRPDEQPDEENPTIDDDTLKEHMTNASPDVRYATLENLHKTGRISDEQHERGKIEYLPPDFQPLWERVGATPSAPAPDQQATSPVTTPTATTPTSPTLVTEEAPKRGPAVVHDIGDFADRRPERVENDENSLLRESPADSLNWQRRKLRGKPSIRDKADADYEEGLKKRYEDLKFRVAVAEEKHAELKKNAPPEPPKKEGAEDDREDWLPSFEPPTDLEKAAHDLQTLRKELERVVAMLAIIARKNAERASNLEKINGANVIEMPNATAPGATAEPIVEEKAAHPTLVSRTEDVDEEVRPQQPERVPNANPKVVDIFSRMGRAAEGAPAEAPTNLDKPEMVVELGPKTTSKLEKLSEQQLEELKTINKSLARQIEQADLEGDAARRETPGDAMSTAEAVNAKKKGASGSGGGGLFNSLFGGIMEGVGQKLFGRFGNTKIGKFFGLGGGAAADAAGAAAGAAGTGAAGAATKAAGKAGWWGRLTGMLRGGKAAAGAAGAAGAGTVGALGAGAGAAGAGVGTVGAAAGATGTVAKGVSTAAKGASGAVGFLGKGTQFLGKMAGFGKVLGKLALPLTIIMGIIDFVSGFINAEQFLDKGKKLTMLDRTAGGIGGVIKGLTGIIDFILGLFGIKTDIGGILGKASAKMFADVFKAIGAIFKVIYEIAKPILAVVGKILEFAAGRIGKIFEVVGEFFEFFGNFVEGIADIISAIFSGDPEKQTKLLKEGFSKIFSGLWGMIKNIGKFFLRMMGVDMLMDAFDGLKKNISDAITGVGDWFKSLFDFDKWKDELVEMADKVLSFIKAPFKWLLNKLGIGGGEDKKKSVASPSKGAPTTTTSTKPTTTPSAPSTPAPTPTTAPTAASTPTKAWGPPTSSPEKQKPSAPSTPDAVPTTAQATSPAPTQVAPKAWGPPNTRQVDRQTAQTSKNLYSPQRSVETPSLAQKVGNAGVWDRPGGGMYKPMKITAGQQKNIDILTQSLQDRGMNQRQIAAILGNVGKESGFTTKEENLNYGQTSNDRIRSIFGKERTNMSDEALNQLKSDPKAFADAMYGRGSKIGRSMGNMEEGDGWKFRGRGFIQLTGRNNYTQASKEIFGDDRLVKNPDLVSQPEVAAKVTAWFTDKHGKSMAKRMGIDTASGSQRDLNLLYTSTVAGRAIRPGEGYLGGEVLGKVDTYASQFGGGKPTQIGAEPPVQLASAASKPVAPSNAAPLPSPRQDQQNASALSGPRLLAASTQGSQLKEAARTTETPQPNVIASTQNVTRGGDQYRIGLNANNTEPTYQRTMNSQYVPT